ncbi:hypothetical protein NBRC10512_003683 [Rhodotorula toruloides]|uniref:RHTO0S13e02938g1_1 n=2 Tax=Rhodotorula toruloides TaxID=5286 RepID=A0A061BAC3_RHOTO|nr:Zn(2)-C7 fungal-type transcription factor [Rhodotorula toruloides NP11]EMS22461.1 Zn(2)-C7 fungal-type transcription factor [Rhodotorula toruloides NP11]CDR46887.1 RHTO0S13e02938g1_1 [Rhodotorula toruloides]
MTGTTVAKPRKSSTKGKSIVQKNPLPKGQSCSVCRARKVRCDAGRPACRACLRTARFEGKDLSTVVCQYDTKVGGGAEGKKGKGKAVASSPGNSTISSSGTARPGDDGWGMSGFQASLDAALAAGGSLTELPANATLPPMPSATTLSTPSQMYDPSLGGSPYLPTALPPLAYTPTPPLSYSSGEDESIFAYSPPATTAHASGLTAATYDPWTGGGQPPLASTSRVLPLPQQHAPLPPGYYFVPTNAAWYAQGAGGQGGPSQSYSGSPQSTPYGYPSQQYATQYPAAPHSYPTPQYQPYPPSSSQHSSATPPQPLPPPQKPRMPAYQLKKPHLSFELPPPIITSALSPSHPPSAGFSPAISYARASNDPTFSLPFAHAPQGDVNSPFGAGGANFHSGLTPSTPQASYAGMWPTPGAGGAAQVNGNGQASGAGGKAGTPGLANVDEWLRGLQQ